MTADGQVIPNGAAPRFALKGGAPGGFRQRGAWQGQRAATCRQGPAAGHGQKADVGDDRPRLVRGRPRSRLFQDRRSARTHRAGPKIGNSARATGSRRYETAGKSETLRGTCTCTMASSRKPVTGLAGRPTQRRVSDVGGRRLGPAQPRSAGSRGTRRALAKRLVSAAMPTMPAVPRTSRQSCPWRGRKRYGRRCSTRSPPPSTRRGRVAPSSAGPARQAPSPPSRPPRCGRA